MTTTTTTTTTTHLRAALLATLGLAALLAGPTPARAAGDTSTSFNFEISKRTEAAVRAFMTPPVDVNALTSNGFRLGGLNLDDVPAYALDQFTKLVSYPTLYMVYAGFDTGFFNGYIRGFDADGNHVYKYTERTGPNPNDPHAEVRKYWWADTDTGAVDWTIIRNRTYDHRARSWYLEAKAAAGDTVWSSIYPFASTNELGLTHCQPVINSTGDISGILAVDYTLGNIDSFLSDAYANTDRSVFIVEHKTGLLVASSTADPLLALKANEEGAMKPTRVPAVEHPDSLISGISKYLDEVGWKETLVVNGGHYIQVKNYRDGALDWDIVVAMPADSAADNILPGTGTYAGITVVALLGVGTNLVCLLLLFVGRSKNIWKAAQPAFLVAFATAQIFINLSSMVFLGQNSDASCMARPWVFNVAFTFVFAILFVKVHRVNALFNNKKMKRVRMGTGALVGRVVGLVMIEVLIQSAWSVADPNAATVILGTGPQGEFIETVVCASNSPAFAGITIGFKAFLILWGCSLAWKTRNVHGAFAESKSIMLVMYNIAFLSLIVLMLYYFLNVSASAKVVIQSIVVLCVTILSCILLFGTRIFKLYTEGDIDIQEIVRAQTMMTAQTHQSHTYAGGATDREKELEAELKALKQKLKSATIAPLNAIHKAQADLEAGNGGTRTAGA